MNIRWREGTIVYRVRGKRKYVLAMILAFASVALWADADRPYAPSRDYDLRHSKIELRFDLEKRKVIGSVTHWLVALNEGTTSLSFDSVGLTIHSVSVNSRAAEFVTTLNKLVVKLPSAARAGEKIDVEIRYEGKPRSGLYFMLPDRDYPKWPKQIWTQGEPEDTRYYLPIYDYPNDRLTTEMVVTVPAEWITISNGRLVSVTKGEDGLRTWRWSEAVPSSTYLITLVAGEFDEVKYSWRGLPVTYYAPRGRGDRLITNFRNTPEMMELFSKRLGVDYPWEKYAQAMVDNFIASGMENSSATTLTSASLVDPRLANEYLTGQDELISHELAHQWFGDLVTCKDWGNIWLNEGLATHMEALWIESRYGKDQVDYKLWESAREWFSRSDLFTVPIVRHDFNDSNESEFDANAYKKAGWVLHMLHHQLGDQVFYHALQHYLEVNRGDNVVTADFGKAVEESSHINIDEFLDQWVYGAGAPKFDLRYSYDSERKEVKLDVKQTQVVEGRMRLFRLPVEIEIETERGKKTFVIIVSKESESFIFPTDKAPLMVLFDKGGNVLKSAEFHKEVTEWLYQEKNAADFANRAEAVVALSNIKNDDRVTMAIGEALRTDRALGIRILAADALGDIGTSAAAKEILAALEKSEDPWVRSHIVGLLVNFKGNAAVAAKLAVVVREDKSYRARANALGVIGSLKLPNAFDILLQALDTSSPDDILRNSALRGLGMLEDDRALPMLLDWSTPGRPISARSAAIWSMGRMDKNNHEITRRIAEYLTDPHYAVQVDTISALGDRGDQEAIKAFEPLLQVGEIGIRVEQMIRQQLLRLKSSQAGVGGQQRAEGLQR